MTTLINTIPVSKLVKVTPSVLSAGTGISYINGLILSNNSAIAQGTLKAYSNATDVATDFTASSIEAQMASVYFAGTTNGLNTPAVLYIYGVGTQTDAPTIMNALTAQNQSFSGFTTSFALTEDQLKAFATWTGEQNARYWFVAYDTPDLTNINNSFGAWLVNQNIDGTTVIYKDPMVAAFCLSWMASLDFSDTDGRVNLALSSSGVISPDVTNTADYDILLSNGYNVYAPYANGTGRWNLLYNGSVSGRFDWADSYINQIWINGSIQADLINLLTSRGSIPYNSEGDALISAAINDTMRQARNFGAIQSGVSLSDEQKAALKLQSGLDISQALFSTGYYVQPNASNTPATDRQARRSPPVRVWYTDGQSIQSINVSSIEVQ